MKLKRTFSFFRFFFIQVYTELNWSNFSKKKKRNTRREVSFLNIYINLASRFGFQYLSRGKEAISLDKRRTDYSRGGAAGGEERRIQSPGKISLRRSSGIELLLSHPIVSPLSPSAKFHFEQDPSSFHFSSSNVLSNTIESY